MTAITFQNVNKSYHSSPILQNMNIAIKKNTLTGVIGRNGVGKTTALKLIAGFTQPSSGQVTVFGHSPFNNVIVAENRIFVDDRMAFPESFTLKQILREAARFFPNWNATLANGLVDYFDLHLLRRHSALSKGKKSTFNTIIGLAARCPLTIFDEPTTGMDSSARQDFYRALLKEYIAHPRTILVSSHHVEEIEHLLEDVLIIHQGDIGYFGSTTELQEKYIRLIGNEAAIQSFIKKRKTYNKQLNGTLSNVIIDNDLTSAEYAQLQSAAIRTQAVSANDAYITLTSSSKGGIDDVLQRTYDY